MNFFEVRVRAPEVVAVADGLDLRLPGNAGLPAVGESVVLGIRPEDMQVVAASSEVFKFEIDMMEELGAGRLLYGQLAGTVSDNTVFSAGARYNIGPWKLFAGYGCAVRAIAAR